ncbi:ankyrin repeat and SAM domain-containing protein 3-like [Oppia nitens]|uniref:ankyrin repeat and SAM domain-containing protein 3-like n=1 Tax=Oppia nitens TaxID=1686743 RepID=UPI0023DB2F27|nr:ankyrin repeat and SAM domain-containing protein 3-like [Oppia nitens]
MDTINETNDLISASSLGQYNVVEEILCNHLEDVNVVNDSGWTPLVYASNFGHFNIVRLLLRFSAEVNFQDNECRTALMMAASNGHTRCIDILINTGKADKTLTDITGYTALNYAINNGHGSNKLIKNLLSTSIGYQLRGRSTSQSKMEAMPSHTMSWSLQSSNNSVVSSSSDDCNQIFNVYETNAFSNGFWRPNKQHELNPKANNFVPSYVPSFEFLSEKLRILEERVNHLESRLKNEMSSH